MTFHNQPSYQWFIGNCLLFVDINRNYYLSRIQMSRATSYILCVCMQVQVWAALRLFLCLYVCKNVYVCVSVYDIEKERGRKKDQETKRNCSSPFMFFHKTSIYNPIYSIVFVSVCVCMHHCTWQSERRGGKIPKNSKTQREGERKSKKDKVRRKLKKTRDKEEIVQANSHSSTMPQSKIQYII